MPIDQQTSSINSKEDAMKAKTLCTASILSLLLILFIVPASNAFARDWVLLGEEKVSMITDRDVIRVTRSEGKFRKIKIRVRDRGVEFYRVLVIFGNGQRHMVPIRNYIRAGGESRLIDLPGRDRVINRIILEYRSIPGSRDRARVQVWGWRP